jgi:hypothetical protein
MNKINVFILTLLALCVVFSACESSEAKEQRLAKQTELARRDSVVKKYNLQDHTSGSIDSIMSGKKAIQVRREDMTFEEQRKSDSVQRLMRDRRHSDPRFLRIKDSIEKVNRKE